MSKVCGNEQITVKEPGKDIASQCLKCPRCSKGKGASVQCYSVITPDTPLMCKNCDLGETFSAEDGTGVCEDCKSCSDRNELTIKNCTLTSNSECGGCKQRFYRDRLLGDCQPCSHCCGDGRDTEESECKDQNMPSNQVCNVARAPTCRKTPSPPRPADNATTTPSPSRRSSSMKPSTPNGSVFTGDDLARSTKQPSRQTVDSIPMIAPTPNGSLFMHVARTTNQPSRQAVDSSFSTPILVIPGVIAFLILVIVYRLKRKQRLTCRRRKRTSRPTMEAGVPESENLVGIAATDEGKQDEERLPTQNTESPGKFSNQDRPLEEMSNDPSWDFYLEVNQVIVKAGGLNTALDRFETNVGDVGVDRSVRFARRIFVDAVMKKYPSMSGKAFFEAVIGETSLSPRKTKV